MLGPRRLPAKDSPFEAACAVHHIDITLNAQGMSHDRNVSLKFQDANYNTLDQIAQVDGWIASSADGLTLAAAADTFVIGTNGLLIEPISNSFFKLVCNADGLADVTITISAGATVYLVFAMPDGRIQVSSPIVIT